MGDKTGIEWTDATWNPIVGCSICSTGCIHCYAMQQAARIARMSDGKSHYVGTTQPSKAGPVWTGKLARAPDHILGAPLSWKKPRKIFVNSMGDLFHEDVPDEWIDVVFGVMTLAPQHTFQVLTKRAGRMRAYLSQFELRSRYVRSTTRGARDAARDGNRFFLLTEDQTWPLQNVWLGVSTENQDTADERVPELLSTPAAVRFVSAEPLLGPINFTALAVGTTVGGWMDAINRRTWEQALAEWQRSPRAGGNPLASFLEWHGLSVLPNGQMHPVLDQVIVGGESGPKARPMHPDWPRSIRDQCAAAGTAFFFKQWGCWAPAPWKLEREPEESDAAYMARSDAEAATHAVAHWGQLNKLDHRPWSIDRALPAPSEQAGMRWAGKRAAGHRLDGVEHHAMPEARA